MPEQVQLSELSLEERILRDAREVGVDHVYNATFEQNWLKRLIRWPKRLRSAPIGFHALREVVLLGRSAESDGE